MACNLQKWFNYDFGYSWTLQVCVENCFLIVPCEHFKTFNVGEWTKLAFDCIQSSRSFELSLSCTEVLLGFWLTNSPVHAFGAEHWKLFSEIELRICSPSHQKLFACLHCSFDQSFRYHTGFEVHFRVSSIRIFSEKLPIRILRSFLYRQKVFLRQRFALRVQNKTRMNWELEALHVELENFSRAFDDKQRTELYSKLSLYVKQNSWQVVRLYPTRYVSTHK